MSKSGWKENSFDHMAELIKDGYRPTGSSDFKYIGLEHINQQSLSLNFVGHSTEVESNKFRFRAGDILFGKLRPYFRKVYRPHFDGVCSTDIWVVRAKDGIDQGYLFYRMASHEFVDMASSGSSGTRMPRADWNHLKGTKWSLPPLPTQKKIAKILGDLDDKIELNRQTNQTLEAIAQTIYKEWFVNFNFPGATDEMQDSELGPIPKGCRVGKLGEMVDFIKGVSYRSNELMPSKYALVTLKSIARGGGFNSNGFKEFNGKYKDAQVLIEGDTVIAQTDITQNAEVVGCPAVVENPFGYEKLIASIDIVKCVSKRAELRSGGIYYFLKDQRFKDYCLSHTKWIYRFAFAKLGITKL